MKPSFGFPPKHTLLGFINSFSSLPDHMLVGVPDSSQVLRWTLSPKHLSPDYDGAGVCFYFILKVVRASEKKI